MSKRVYKYIYILYEYDSNTMIIALIKNRVKSEMNNAFNIIANTLTSPGFQPKFYMHENKPCVALKNSIIE